MFFRGIIVPVIGHRGRPRSGAIGLSATLLLVGCIIPRFDPDCPDEASCSACLEESGCGFCVTGFGADEGRCVPGTSLGPDSENDCELANWRFDGCSEPPASLGCAAYSTCTTCADDGSCGWCYEAAECRPLDEAEGCELEEDDWSTECNDADFNVIPSCEQCLEAGGHWCAYGGGRCDRDSYDCNDAFRVDSTCPPPNRCSDHSMDCSRCLALPMCGYCREEEYDSITVACIPVDTWGNPYTDGCWYGATLYIDECSF